MGRLYADEQFPYEVVEHLRNFGHDVLDDADSRENSRSYFDRRDVVRQIGQCDTPYAMNRLVSLCSLAVR